MLVVLRRVRGGGVVSAATQADLAPYLKRVGRCLNCGASIWFDQDQCSCHDEMPTWLPGLSPVPRDAAERRPVAVVREGRSTVTGRLLSVGGDRRTPNGRAKVELPSGAVITPHVWEVVLLDGDEVAS